MNNAGLKESLRSEGGQIIVLLIITLTALLGGIALTVDGGQLYLDRVTTQTVADNAALAGAWAICAGKNAGTTSLASALQNGFTNDGSTNSVVVNNPPTSGPGKGDKNFVEVIITSKFKGVFSSLVYSGPLQATSSATARCQSTSEPIGNGNALIALSSNQKDAFKTNGNGVVTVSQGSIYINSNHSQAMSLTGNAIVKAIKISVVGGYSVSGGGAYNPTPTKATAMMNPLASLAAPPKPGGNCTSYSLSSGSASINPGLYCSISASGSSVLTMNAGVYYISTGDLTVSNSAKIQGTGVLIYVEKGQVSISGGDFNITAPSSGDYKGLVLLLGSNNSNTVSIGGQGSSFLSGTIYAPLSLLKLSGGGQNDILKAQIIASTIQTSGNGAITIIYDPTVLYEGPKNKIVELIK